MGQQRPGHARHLVGERHRHDLEEPRQELRNDRRPSRRMIMFVMQYQSHRAGTDLRRELVTSLLAHWLHFSRVGASGKPEVHSAIATHGRPSEPGRTFRVYELLLVGVHKRTRIMAQQIVMDVTGDTRHEFDPTDAAALAQARARFKQLTDAGFTAAVRKGSGISQLVRHFDPAADETVFFPRLRGG
jgi:hypothetical protein